MSSARLLAEVLAIHYDPLALTLRVAILRQPGSEFCEVRRCVVTPELLRFTATNVDADILAISVRAFFAMICARFVAKRVGNGFMDVLIAMRVRKCGHPCGLATAPSGIPGFDYSTIPALWKKSKEMARATRLFCAGGALRMVAGFDDYLHGEPETSDDDELLVGQSVGAIPMMPLSNKGKEKVIYSTSESDSDGFDGEKEKECDQFVHQASSATATKRQDTYWVFDEDYSHIGGRAPLSREEFLATYFGPSAGKVRGRPMGL